MEKGKVHKDLSFDPILSQMNLFHIPQPVCLRYTHRVPKSYLPFKFSY